MEFIKATRGLVRNDSWTIHRLPDRKWHRAGEERQSVIGETDLDARFPMVEWLIARLSSRLPILSRLQLTSGNGTGGCVFWWKHARKVAAIEGSAGGMHSNLATGLSGRRGARRGIMFHAAGA